MSIDTKEVSMKNFILLALLCLLLTGCPSINPRLNTPIQNQNGKIEDLKSNQNGVIAEIGKLRQENQMQNSKIDELQQGLLNVNAYLSRNENNGVQILQGDGALILVFSVIAFGMLLYHYRDKAKQNEKTSALLATEIARFNNAELNDNVLRAAMYTKQEDKVYKLLVNKH
jgi:predicted PurR-regulated permease PerM